MAFMDQARKKGLEALCREHGKKFPAVKWSMRVRHHSTVVFTIASGDIDFAADAVDREGRTASGHLGARGECEVNRYRLAESWKGRALEFLQGMRDALYTGNHDRSDIQSDYFDVGWYVQMQIGRWDKPYQYKPAAEQKTEVAA